MFSSMANARLSRPRRVTSLSRMRWIGLIALAGLGGSVLAAQEPDREPPTQGAQKCAALTELNLENAPGGPAIITSARVVEVPVGGLEPPFFHPSGYASSAAAQVASKIKQYCDVIGYVAPQNKFELKLPLPADWNQKFYFYACGGFCGRVVGGALNFGLSRRQPSAPGNGGPATALGFHGILA